MELRWAVPTGTAGGGGCVFWHCLSRVLDHVSCVWDVAFGADGDLVTASGDSVAYVWTAEDSRKVSLASRSTIVQEVWTAEDLRKVTFLAPIKYFDHSCEASVAAEAHACSVAFSSGRSQVIHIDPVPMCMTCTVAGDPNGPECFLQQCRYSISGMSARHLQEPCLQAIDHRQFYRHNQSLHNQLSQAIHHRWLYRRNQT
eukprot:scaffold22763_cov22-Tisochrysis_lutea.AAC.2